MKMKNHKIKPCEIPVEIRGLCHNYQTGRLITEALCGIDLVIRSRTSVFLTGCSGSGKTTLISLIGCLRSVQHGSLKLFGQEMNGAGQAQLYRMRRLIGFVFQHFNLLDFMTISQNVQQSLRFQPGCSGRKARLMSEEILERVGLGDRIDSYPFEISGGQKQRVAIARALVHGPKLVLADEPTAALDSVTGREIIEMFQKLAKEQNSAVLVVTHNTRILDNADEIFELDDGRLGTAAREHLSLALPPLTDCELDEIVKYTFLRIYRPGQTIICQGGPAEFFYILLKGEVEIMCSRQGSNEKITANLNRRGDFFGETGLMHKDNLYPESVRAAGTQDVEVLVINQDSFQKMIHTSEMTHAIIRDKKIQRMKMINNHIPTS